MANAVGMDRTSKGGFGSIDGPVGSGVGGGGIGQAASAGAVSANGGDNESTEDLKAYFSADEYWREYLNDMARKKVIEKLVSKMADKCPVKHLFEDDVCYEVKQIGLCSVHLRCIYIPCVEPCDSMPAFAQLGVDYTCVLNGQFGCAFHGRMRFRCHFQSQKLKNYIANAFDRETHIQTTHSKRKCNRPLNAKQCILLPPANAASATHGPTHGKLQVDTDPKYKQSQIDRASIGPTGLQVGPRFGYGKGATHIAVGAAPQAAEGGGVINRLVPDGAADFSTPMQKFLVSRLLQKGAADNRGARY
jgi:hypothetical protein